MASPPNEDGDFDEEEEDDEVEDGTEASRPCAVASQVKSRLWWMHHYTLNFLSVILYQAFSLNY